MVFCSPPSSNGVADQRWVWKKYVKRWKDFRNGSGYQNGWFFGILEFLRKFIPYDESRIDLDSVTVSIGCETNRLVKIGLSSKYPPLKFWGRGCGGLEICAGLTSPDLHDYWPFQLDTEMIVWLHCRCVVGRKIAFCSRRIAFSSFDSSPVMGRLSWMPALQVGSWDLGPLEPLVPDETKPDFKPKLSLCIVWWGIIAISCILYKLFLSAPPHTYAKNGPTNWWEVFLK